MNDEVELGGSEAASCSSSRLVVDLNQVVAHFIHLSFESAL